MKKRPRLLINAREDPTHDQVMSHYNYDPVTGKLYRTIEYDGWNNPSKCFKLIDGRNNRGYRWDKLFGHMFLAHRLIWFYMTGEHPSGEIDHIDGDRLNNRWCNLRHVDAFENSRNQGERKDNTSGCRGIFLVISQLSTKLLRYANKPRSISNIIKIMLRGTHG